MYNSRAFQVQEDSVCVRMCVTVYIYMHEDVFMKGEFL